MNNFSEHQLLPMMEFLFKTLLHSFSILSLLKYVSDFTADVFTSEKELSSWTYLLKKAPRRTILLISLVWNKNLKIWYTLFELIQIEVQCSKNYFKKFLTQEAGAFGNKIEEEPQKPYPKLKRICILYLYKEYLLCLHFNGSGCFLKACVNFAQ